MTTQASASDNNPYVGPRAFEAREKDLFQGRRRELASLANLLIAERIVLLHSPSGAGKTSLIQAGLIPKLQADGFRVLPVIRVGQVPGPHEGVAAPNRYIFSALLALEEPAEVQPKVPLRDLAGMTLDRYLDLRTILHLEQQRAPAAPLALDDLIGLSWERYHDWRVLLHLEESQPADSRLSPGELIGLTPDQYWQRRRAAAGTPEADRAVAVLAEGHDATSLADALDPADGDGPAPPRPTPRVETDPELLVFDPFEEILTADPDDEAGKEEFFKQVGQALRRDRRRWALFAMREDYLGPLDPYLGWIPTRLANTFRLDLLRQDPAIEAIRRPAQHRRVPFTKRAARTLTENLRRVQARRPGGPTVGLYVEPIQLQVVCREFWERLHRARGGAIRGIRKRDVLEAAEVDKTLADYYAGRVAEAAARTRTRERTIREWFEYDLITAGRRNLVRLDHAIQRLGLDAVRRLGDAYLVREVPRHGEVWLELAHDRLILPIQQDNVTWFATKLGARARRFFSKHWLFVVAAVIGVLGVCLGIAIWSSIAARKAARTTDRALKEKKEAFVKVSQEKAKISEEKKKIEEDLKKIHDYNKQIILEKNQELEIGRVREAVLKGLLSNSNQAAGRTVLVTAQAESVQLAAKVMSLLRDQPDLALLLALEAYRKRDNVETRGSLLSALEAIPQLTTYLRDHAGQPVHGVAFSPDGRILASGGADGTIVLRDAETHQPWGGPLTGHEGPVLCLAFDPRDRTLASGGADGTIRLWAVAPRDGAPRPVRCFREHTRAVLQLAFGPNSDGRTLASCGADGTVRLWDVAEGKSRLLAEQFAQVSSLAFSPDGKVAAGGCAGADPSGGSAEGEIRLWDVATGARSGPPIRGHPGAVTSLAFSPDGTILASGGGAISGPDDVMVLFWDARTGSPIAYPFIGYKAAVTGLAFGQDPRAQPASAGTRRAGPALWLASAGADKTIRYGDVRAEVDRYQAAGYRQKRELEKALASRTKADLIRLATTLDGRLVAHQGAVASVAFRNDGRTLASGGADGAVIVWDLTRRQRLGTTLRAASATGVRLTLSPGGATLAQFGAEDGTIRLDHVGAPGADGAPTTLRDGSAAVQLVALDPTGKSLAAVNREAEVYLWDLTRPERRAAPTLLGILPVASLAFSADGRTLASGGLDSTVLLWDVCTGQPKGPSLAGHDGPLSSLAFSADGRTLASGDRTGAIRLWSVDTGRPAVSLAGHTGAVHDLAFSPDGRILASAGEDTAVFLWDVPGTRPLGLPLAGHKGVAVAVAFSPDGQTLASGGWDNAIILWDVASRRPAGPPLRGHPSAVQDLAFRPDGRRLVATYAGGEAISWDLDVGSWEARACSIARRNLSPEEWTEFIGAEPYRKTCPDLPDLHSLDPYPTRGPALLVAARWQPGQTIRVRFLVGDPALHARVAAIAAEWSRYANLRFEFGSDPRAEVRIAFRTGSSWSYIGTQCLDVPPTAPTMDLGKLTGNPPEAEFRGTVLHEFGHVLGLIHEHQKPDADIAWNVDALVRDFTAPPHNWSRAEVYEFFLRRYESKQVQMDPGFDRHSIMTVPILRKYTLDGFEVGSNSELSEGDKRFIARAYPVAPPITESAPAITGSFPGTGIRISNAIRNAIEADLIAFYQSPESGETRIEKIQALRERARESYSSFLEDEEDPELNAQERADLNAMVDRVVAGAPLGGGRVYPPTEPGDRP